MAKLARYTAPAEVKLALAWAALMFLYVYNDYFSLYLPGAIARIEEGRIGPLGPATDSVLIGVAMMLAIPALMILLSAVLPAIAGRWLNVLLGLVYTAIEVMTSLGARPFYQIVVGFEIAVTVFIVWTALRWPKAAA